MVDLSKEKWQQTTGLLGDLKYNFGPHWSYNFRNDPARLSFVLSRYKFAAKVACKDANILELGCSEGIGSSILAEQAVSYTGIDLDKTSIKVAKQNYNKDKFTFIAEDFLNKKYGLFQAIVSLDVVEHIHSESENFFFQTIVDNLDEKGICVIGTPNITASEYASKASKIGHVNLFSQKRLVETLAKYFYQVLPFGMNDEIMHTGFGNMAHYLLCVACDKKN